MPEDTTEALEFEDDSALILDAAHTGDMNFIVGLLDLNDGSKDSLINSMGEFDGRIITHVEPGKYTFNITYDEDYSINPVSISPDEIQTPPFSRSGTYHDVIPVSVDGPLRMEFSTNGDASFQNHTAVILYDLDGSRIDTIINDASMEATEHAITITTQGDMYISVEYNGSWSLSLDEL